MAQVKFLSQEGLVTVWNRIKEVFATKEALKSVDDGASTSIGNLNKTLGETAAVLLESDAKIATDLANEIKAREDEDTALLVHVNTVDSNLMLIDQQLSEAIDNANTKRKEADSAIMIAMNQNVSNLAAIDTQLSQAIGNEQATRANKDNDLQAQIDKLKLNEPQYSEGLVYAHNEDGVTYAVADIGTCTDTDIVIPPTYEGLPVTRIASNAFYNNENIVSITIPNSVIAIETTAISHCPNLQTVIMGNSITELGTHVFSWNENLQDIVFPDSITVIPNGLFYGCHNLKTATFGNALVSFGEFVFTECNGLKIVTLYTETPPTIVQGSTFHSIPDVFYVPANSVNTYKIAENWSQYADLIKPIDTFETLRADIEILKGLIGQDYVNVSEVGA